MDTGATRETRKISTVGTAGASGTGITLVGALASAHASGAAVAGTGITLSSPLTYAHSANQAVSGNSLTVTKPLTKAHAAGVPLTDPSSGVTVADGALIYTCSATFPTPYAEWPDPTDGNVTLSFTPGAPATGGLSLGAPTPTAGTETLTDNATILATTLANAASSPNRLIFLTPPLGAQVRISGTPWLTLRMAFSRAKANLAAMLVSYPPGGGAGTIITRGWLDPENRDSISVSTPVVPGTFYSLHFDMEPKDTVLDTGSRLGVMILSSDNETTIRPAPGALLTMDLGASTVMLPIVGGTNTFGAAIGGATTTALTADSDATERGHPVTFTATVAPIRPAAGIPTGSVQFNLDGAPAGPSVALDTAGQATWTTSTLPIGAHVLTAGYPGNDYFASSGSPSLGHRVNPGPLDYLQLAPASHTISAGASQAYTAEAFDGDGNDLGDVTASTTFTITGGGTCNGATCTSSTVGDYTVTGINGTATGTATLHVTAGPLDHLVLAPATATIPAGGSRPYTATGYDAFNNSRGDVTAATTFTISPDGSCTGAACTASLPGPHTVTGTSAGRTGTAALGVTDGAPPTGCGKPGVSLSTAVAVGGTVKVHVSWPAGSDAAGPPVTYQLSRSTNGGAWVALALAPATVTSTDVALAPGTSTYRFEVRCLDAGRQRHALVRRDLLHPLPAAGDLERHRLWRCLDPRRAVGCLGWLRALHRHRGPQCHLHLHGPLLRPGDHQGSVARHRQGLRRRGPQGHPRSVRHRHPGGAPGVADHLCHLGQPQDQARRHGHEEREVQQRAHRPRRLRGAAVRS